MLSPCLSVLGYAAEIIALRTVEERRAANESETKPPNLEKNRTSKPPTGGASL
ncbi:hypothetical protein [Methylovulum sp.]|uniref:hypothetical protein n=1 Tax=Methylovulum sp. TaxID=1916980 RepID=UPI00263180D9|nr:hypothetical protein [Methylovulum sp.]MDD5126223.1 hypothetical protein [Methylovulum sp.]